MAGPRFAGRRDIDDVDVDFESSRRAEAARGSSDGVTVPRSFDPPRTTTTTTADRRRRRQRWTRRTGCARCDCGRNDGVAIVIISRDRIYVPPREEEELEEGKEEEEEEEEEEDWTCERGFGASWPR
jgi:hypothetical protein